MVNRLNLLVDTKAIDKNGKGKVHLLIWSGDHVSYIGSSFVRQSQKINNVMYIP